MREQNWVRSSQLLSRAKDNTMATPKRKKTTLDKDLAKALTDLNKVFSATSLGKKFKIKPWKVYYYKRYRKRKPFPKKIKGKILRFYKKLRDRKKEEDLRYHYKVVKRKRLKPVTFIGKIKTKELIKKIGKDELAKRMGVKPKTIERWAEGRFDRVRKKTKEKLYQEYKKIRELAGIFFLYYRFKTRWGKRRILREYCKIKYYPGFSGTKQGFLDYIREKEFYDIEEYLIAEQRKFKLLDVIKFLKNLKNVSQAYFIESIEDCRQFIEDNFDRKQRTKLLKNLSKYE